MGKLVLLTLVSLILASAQNSVGLGASVIPVSVKDYVSGTSRPACDVACMERCLSRAGTISSLDCADICLCRSLLNAFTLKIEYEDNEITIEDNGSSGYHVGVESGGEEFNVNINTGGDSDSVYSTADWIGGDGYVIAKPQPDGYSATGEVNSFGSKIRFNETAVANEEEDGGSITVDTEVEGEGWRAEQHIEDKLIVGYAAAALTVKPTGQGWSWTFWFFLSLLLGTAGIFVVKVLKKSKESTTKAGLLQGSAVYARI